LAADDNAPALHPVNPISFGDRCADASPPALLGSI